MKRIVGGSEMKALDGCTITGMGVPSCVLMERAALCVVEVIKKESEPSLKYHMFKRLNTGGELLSAQEIRNCTIRLLGSKGIEFLDKCSQNEDFKAVIKRIGEDKFKSKYDQELVLRFFAVKNDLDDYRYPVTEYLTRYLEKITINEEMFDYQKEYQIFCDTFHFINSVIGENAFSGKTGNGTIKQEFVLYYFDGISVPVASFADRITSYPEPFKIKEAIEKIKYGKELRSYKTGSVNGIKTRIELFKKGVQEALDA